MDPWAGDRVLGESLFTLLKFAVLPIAKVLVMCALGLLLASSSVNILPAPSRRQLSKVTLLSPVYPKFASFHLLGLLSPILQCIEFFGSFSKPKCFVIFLFKKRN
jgi:hypothetical protein